MQVLVADSLPEKAIAELESRGHTCEVDPGLGEAELADRIPGFDILVVRSTKVTDSVLVANVPGRNSAAVAELTMGLLLAVDRRIPDNVVDLREGRWNKKAYSKATGLLGSTLGIVGLGSVGLCVAERAVAFGIKVQTLEKPHRREETAA